MAGTKSGLVMSRRPSRSSAAKETPGSAA